MAIYTKEEFINKVSIGVLMGIDWGKKSIGIAVCDPDQNVALPLKAIPRLIWKDLSANLLKYTQDYKVEGIIVGWPLQMDGSFSQGCQSVQDFVKNLMNSIDLPICLCDERVSTRGAYSSMIGADRRAWCCGHGSSRSNSSSSSSSKNKDTIDHFAASFILQGFLDWKNSHF